MSMIGLKAIVTPAYFYYKLCVPIKINLLDYSSLLIKFIFPVKLAVLDISHLYRYLLLKTQNLKYNLFYIKGNSVWLENSSF